MNVTRTTCTTAPFRLITACCLLLLGGCQLADMTRFIYANAVARHHWLDETNSTALRFDMVDDHIVVPMSVNGSDPLQFVVDTGAGATVILESAATRKLSLRKGAEITVSGVGDGPDPVANIVADTDLAMGSLRMEDLSVIYLPLASIPFFDNLDEVYFDGVIGAQFFERFVVEIDYDQQLITFSEPGSGAPKPRDGDDGWQQLTLQIDSGVPYIETRINTDGQSSEVVKLLVDTGYRGPVSLTPATHEGIDEPVDYYSYMSQGLSGDVASRMGVSPSFSLGSFELKQVPTSYAISGGESESGSNGLLGNEVLRRFNLVFDYPNERMLIKPNREFPTVLHVDRSGLLLRPHKLGAVVKSVASDSAAANAELHRGDIITHIDGQAVEDNNIAALKQLLGSDRETVSVTRFANGQTQHRELVLSSRF